MIKEGRAIDDDRQGKIQILGRTAMKHLPLFLKLPIKLYVLSDRQVPTMNPLVSLFYEVLLLIRLPDDNRVCVSPLTESIPHQAVSQLVIIVVVCIDQLVVSIWLNFHQARLTYHDRDCCDNDEIGRNRSQYDD
jgi:hypothetical protein